MGIPERQDRTPVVFRITVVAYLSAARRFCYLDVYMVIVYSWLMKKQLQKRDAEFPSLPPAADRARE